MNTETFKVRNNRGSRIRGFTLIELIVSVGIISMISLGVVAFQRSVIVNTKVIQSSLQAEQQIRKALKLFVADARTMITSAAGGYPIESVATSSIVFYANIDSDASVERVRYFFATSTTGGSFNALKRGVIKPTGTLYTGTEKISTLVNDVKNSASLPLFTYFDANYNGTASSTAPLPSPVTISSVRLIKMDLAVDPNAARSPIFHTYSTIVTLRNLKDNF